MKTNFVERHPNRDKVSKMLKADTTEIEKPSLWCGIEPASLVKKYEGPVKVKKSYYGSDSLLN